MKQILNSILDFLTSHGSWERKRQRDMADWGRDPLSHPDILQMSERERADLHFNPRCIKSE